MRRIGVRLIGGSVLLALAVTATLVWRMPEMAAWRWYVRSGKPEMSAAKVTLSRQLQWFDDYYVVGNLGEGAYAIGEPLYGQCNFSYLIVGSQRALLFDTGPGVRDIRPVIRALTALPVEAIPSHLHFDHVGDLDKFADVALPDLPPLRAQYQAGGLRLGFYQYLGFVEGFKRRTLPVTHWIAPGSDIDLGGRRLTLLSMPGHTPDSVVLLDRGANRLFAGDFIYPSRIYAFLPGANLRDYKVSAGKLAGLLEEHSLVYGAHGCDSVPTQIPALRRSDVVALEKALEAADSPWRGNSAGWYPRRFTVNERMELLAKYTWMRP